MLLLKIGSKLPLYAFKKLEKVVGEEEKGEPPVAFLDSLVLGEVSCFDSILQVYRLSFLVNETIGLVC